MASDHSLPDVFVILEVLFPQPPRAPGWKEEDKHGGKESSPKAMFTDFRERGRRGEEREREREREMVKEKHQCEREM